MNQGKNIAAGDDGQLYGPPVTKFGKKPSTCPICSPPPFTFFSLAPAPKAALKLNAGAAPPLGLTIEASIAWQAKFNDWSPFNNDTMQTCTPAAAANLIITWTANSNNGNASVPVLADVMKAYQIAGDNNAPGADTGCAISDLLYYWQLRHIGTDAINDFAKITPNNQDQLKLAIFWYGGAMVGFQLPSSIQNIATQTRWEIPLTKGTPDQGVNGHTAAALGYDGTAIAVISWGRLVWVNWDFYNQYNDETWIVLSQNDWAPSGSLSPPPSSQAFATLNTALKAEKANV